MEMKQFDLCEADLKAALEVEPTNPALGELEFQLHTARKVQLHDHEYLSLRMDGFGDRLSKEAG